MKKARKSDINLRDKITPKKLKIPVRIAILNWVGTPPPPRWGRLRLKLRKGTKLSLRRFFL